MSAGEDGRGAGHGGEVKRGKAADDTGREWRQESSNFSMVREATGAYAAGKHR